MEIVSVDLRNAGTSSAVVNIWLKNNSDKEIFAVALESGNAKDASGTSFNGFHDGDVPPTVVVGPHETFEMNFSLENVKPGYPIKIGGVIYANGTEDGAAETLGTMRRQKEYGRNKLSGGSAQR